MTDLEKLALHIGKIEGQLECIENRLRHVLDHVYRIEDDVRHIRYGEGQAHATAMMHLASGGDTDPYQQFQQLPGQLGPQQWNETIAKQQETLRRRAAGETEGV